MPALATSTSTGPCAASTWSNAASTDAESVTSQATASSALRRVPAARRHGDLVALREEALGDGATDAAVASGDQDAARLHRGRGRGARVDCHGRDATGSVRARVTSAVAGRRSRFLGRARDPDHRVRRPRGPDPHRPAGARRRRGQHPRRRHLRRHQLRRHPPGRGLLPGPADAAARPRCRGGRHPTLGRQARGGAARRRRGLRRGRGRAGRRHLRAAGRGLRLRRPRAGAAGHHGVAPAAHQCPPGRGRDRRRAQRRGRRRQHRRAAGARSGAPAASSPPRRARTSATSRSTSAPTSPSTPPPARTRPAWPRCCATPTTDAGSTSCWR